MAQRSYASANMLTLCYQSTARRTGLHIAEGYTKAPELLRLGVGHLFACEPCDGPGVRALDVVEGGVPELMHVSDLSTSAGALAAGTYHGRWLVDLRGFSTQVVPTREMRRDGKCCRYFITANKSSGRSLAFARE